MNLFPPPTGTEISPEQARALDDSFFSSNPMGYFQSRIDALIAWSSGPPVDYSSGLGRDLLRRLGLKEDAAGETSDDTRSMQIASDSFSLRHHVAECTVRLFASLVRQQQGVAQHPALWAEISEDRDNGVDLVKRVNNFFMSDASGAKFTKMVLPASLIIEHSNQIQFHRALGVIADWLGHACRLLVDGALDINAANNKSKHGLAVRPRDDVRLTFTTVAPDTHGNVPLSALTGDRAFNVFDAPFLESLSSPHPRAKKQTQGMELNWIQLHAPTLLAEATMISVVHGALFHVAAARHLEGGSDFAPPLFPALPLGPTPDELLQNTTSGMRWPVTLPEGANQPGRKAAIVRHDMEVPLSIDGVGRAGQVVQG